MSTRKRWSALDNKKDYDRYINAVEKLQVAIDISESELPLHQKRRLLSQTDCDQFIYSSLSRSGRFRLKRYDEYIKLLKEELHSFNHAIKTLQDQL